MPWSLFWYLFTFLNNSALLVLICNSHLTYTLILILAFFDKDWPKLWMIRPQCDKSKSDKSSKSVCQNISRYENFEFLQVIRANCFSSFVGQLTRKLAYLIPVVVATLNRWRRADLTTILNKLMKWQISSTTDFLGRSWIFCSNHPFPYYLPSLLLLLA